MLNRDFRDLLCAFNEAKVRYLVVGAHALAAHGHVRATKDLDVWVDVNRANARRVITALERFGAPTGSLTIADFATPGLVFQIGVAPVRIDVLTEISGVSFKSAWPRRQRSTYGDQAVAVLAVGDLITNKRAAGRAQDLADLEVLVSATRPAPSKRQRPKPAP